MEIEIEKVYDKYYLGNSDCSYTYEERLEIRRRYKLLEEDLLSGKNVGTDVYFWKMSAVETLVWTDLRWHGILMYPQYPIKNYFVDFALPRQKIALEIDSVKWHTDKERDLKRQKEIESEGYVVIRATSKDVLTNNPFPQINDIIKLRNAFQNGSYLSVKNLYNG